MEKTENQKYDLFYLNENGKVNVKESFKFILTHARPVINKYPNPQIADVGCAVGDLLAYIGSQFPNAHLHGLDIQPELLAKAKNDLPSASFHLYDILAGAPTLDRKFDVVFMCGVHGAFEDPTQWLRNFLQLLNTNGTAYVYGNFNPDPIDVIVRVRPASSHGAYISNWNMVSQKTMIELLATLGYQAEFSLFQIGIDIPKKESDPLRSWTFKFEDGTRGTINGSQLLHHNYLLKISRA